MSDALESNLARLSLIPHFIPKVGNFVHDQLAHAFRVVHAFKAKVELLRAYGFIGGIVPHREVWVLQRLSARDALRRIECQETAEQVECEGVCIGEELLERHWRLVWQRRNILLSTWASDPAQRLIRRRAEVVENLVELVHIVATLEQWAAAQELRKDAANRPQVNSLVDTHWQSCSSGSWLAKKTHESMISGARYQRVATYSVMRPCAPGSIASWSRSKPRERPKSQILSSQSAFTSRFPGFKSR